MNPVYVTFAAYWDTSLVLDVATAENGNGLGLVYQKFDPSYKLTTQIWQMIPNLVYSPASEYGAGFTLYDNTHGLCVSNQGFNNQLLLVQEPTPFGNAEFCFTMFSISDGGSSGFFTLQDPNRGNCIAIQDGAKQPPGKPQIMYSWDNPNSELWLPQPVPMANIPKGWPGNP